MTDLSRRTVSRRNFLAEVMSDLLRLSLWMGRPEDHLFSVSIFMQRSGSDNKSWAQMEPNQRGDLFLETMFIEMKVTVQRPHALGRVLVQCTGWIQVRGKIRFQDEGSRMYFGFPS